MSQQPAQRGADDARAEIVRTLGTVLQPGQVTELRALDVSTPDYRKNHTVSGYFDNPALLATEAARLLHHAKGVYVIPNPVNPSLLARASNRSRPISDREPLTSDADILERRWLLIDADPVRPSGISSSEEEHQLALDRVVEIRTALGDEGWPQPILADSGNGGHLLYRIDEPADDGGLVKRVLEALAFRFDDAQVTVDRKVCNPARIWKLYGSKSRKGDNVPERPHRYSRMLNVPETIVSVPTVLLRQLADSAPIQMGDNSAATRTDTGLDLDAWIIEHNLDLYGPMPWNGGRKWIFRQCPWNPDHRNRSAYIVQHANGAIAAGCHHNSCAEKGWHDLRDAVEPGWRDKAKKGQASRKKSTKKRPEVTESSIEILDNAPESIRRPLCLVGGHAYAATWIWVRTTIYQTTYEDGTTQDHDPPIIEDRPALVLVRDDGQVFSDVGIGEAEPLAATGITVDLPEVPPANRLWSGSGVKRFRTGERPDVQSILRRIVEVVNRFIDFDRSLAAQQVMCELVACYVMATYLLDGFNVIGYLWPNGDRGSGKTHFLFTVAEMAYLGQVILAGGTHATLRDMADYGATLAFDDAEGIMDVKRADPDKRALLLAGNRRGTTVTLKEPAGPGRWVTRHVHTYCPRLFSAIRLPDDVLASRTITIPLVRSADPNRANADPLDYVLWPHERERLRDDLFAMALVALPAIRKYDAKAVRLARLSGRNLQPWRAILAVALWLQQEHEIVGIFDRLEDVSVAYQTERKDLEMTDPTRFVILALWEIVAEVDTLRVTFLTGELVDRVNRLANEAEVSDDGLPFINSKRLGRLLSRLRFRKSDTQKKRGWQTSRSDVEALGRAYGMMLEVPGNADNAYNADNVTDVSTSSAFSTFADKAEERVVEEI